MNKANVPYKSLNNFLYMLYKRYHITETTVLTSFEKNKYGENETYFIVYWNKKEGF
jgi:hypothetical protein